ncbi:MAG: flippase [Actinomycetia bacterium]|nr:flippase [Actinomycetes bacterium]
MKIVVKGSILVFSSVLMSYVIAFARRLVIVRALSTADYGIFALAISIVSLGIVISELGLKDGAQRFVALHRGRGDLERAKGTVYGTAILFTVAAVVTTAALMSSSGAVSSLLDKPELNRALFLLAFLLPIWGATELIVACYQGFEIVAPKVIFDSIGRSLLSTVAVVVAALLFNTLHALVLAFVLGNALTLAALVVYMHYRRFPGLTHIKPRLEIRKLLLFSLPLAVGGFAGQIMHQTDTVMLGYFGTARQVGIYNAAVPLHDLLPVFMVAAGFMYAPVAARMIGEGKDDELRALYLSLTKWLIMFTLPAGIILLFYPSEILRLLFGVRYVGAAYVLQVLVVGGLVRAVVGLNVTTLIAYGKSTLTMLDTVSFAILNIVLNLLLIPRYGINGAAIATTASLITGGIVVSGQVYYFYRIQPIDKNCIKPILASLPALIALYYPLKAALRLTLWILPFYYFLFLAVSIGAVIVTRSLETTDRVLYRALRQRLLATLPGKWKRL